MKAWFTGKSLLPVLYFTFCVNWITNNCLGKVKVHFLQPKTKQWYLKGHFQSIKEDTTIFYHEKNEVNQFKLLWKWNKHMLPETPPALHVKISEWGCLSWFLDDMVQRSLVRECTKPSNQRQDTENTHAPSVLCTWDPVLKLSFVSLIMMQLVTRDWRFPLHFQHQHHHPT